MITKKRSKKLSITQLSTDTSSDADIFAYNKGNE